MERSNRNIASNHVILNLNWFVTGTFISELFVWLKIKFGNYYNFPLYGKLNKLWYMKTLENYIVIQKKALDLCKLSGTKSMIIVREQNKMQR